MLYISLSKVGFDNLGDIVDIVSNITKFNY